MDEYTALSESVMDGNLIKFRAQNDVLINIMWAIIFDNLKKRTSAINIEVYLYGKSN